MESCIFLVHFLLTKWLNNILSRREKLYSYIVAHVNLERDDIQCLPRLKGQRLKHHGVVSTLAQCNFQSFYHRLLHGAPEYLSFADEHALDRACILPSRLEEFLA